MYRASAGEDDVVTAKEDMIAHGDAGELDLAVAVGDGDEGKVTGAAAHIDNQDDITWVDLLAKAFTPSAGPRVERGLRFLEQREVGEAGLLGGGEGEVTGGGVEGRGRGRAHVLLRERRIGKLVIPGRWARYARDASTGETRCTALGRRLPGRIADWQSTPAWLSQLLAEETRRAGTFAPCVRANSPATDPVAAGDFVFLSHGSASPPPAGNSCAFGRYRKDGSSGRGSTVPTAVDLRDGEDALLAAAGARAFEVEYETAGVGRAKVDADLSSGTWSRSGGDGEIRGRERIPGH